MRYLALAEFTQNLNRVIARGQAGGHSAPSDQLRKIHDASLKNLPRAIREMDEILVFDNSALNQQPTLVLSARNGQITHIERPFTSWLVESLAGSEYRLHD
jgi:predicted ABC-type ATPase